MRRIRVAERRARLAVRHHLAGSARGIDVTALARALVALHGTDPAAVFLAAWARLPAVAPADIERALYDDRTLLRMLGMRRTMFVVPVELAPVVQAACARGIAVKERRRLEQHLEEGGVTPDGARWLDAAGDATLRALAARGQALASELAADVPALATRLELGGGTANAARVSAVTRVLFVLAAEGRISRGRPRGSWTSSQYRWVPMESWLPGGLVEPAVDAARVELVRRWLATFGPGTVADLRWWTGWTAGEVKRALAEIGPVEVELASGTGLVLTDDVAPVVPPPPWVALLPALDPTVMGWVSREWYLGEHGPAVFDRSGNPGPTVWSDGRIVGGWAQRPDGEVVFRLLEDVGSEVAAAVAAAAERLRAWLGDVRVTPRFRTPLERDLSR